MPASAPPAVLVAGLARSGTTWLAKLLDSHPGTLYRHEPDRPPLFPLMPVYTEGKAADLYRHALAEFSRRLPGLDRVREAGSLPVFRKSGENAARFQARRAATVMTRLASGRLGNIRLRAVAASPDAEKLRLVWKSVASVGRLACLLEAMQPLQVILLIRHPGGTIASRQRGIARGEMAPVPMAEFAALRDSTSPVAREILAATSLRDARDWEAFRWAVLNSAAITALSDHPGSLVVRYEDLCADPGAVLARVLDCLGLPWDPQVERFLVRSRASTSGRFYGLARTPEDVDQWSRSMDSATRERLRQIIGGTPAGRLYPE